MLKRPLDQVTADDLNALVTGQVPEGRTLEYKRELPARNDAAKRELVKDVSSFANAAGGDLIFGIDDRDADGNKLGYASRVLGLQVENMDEWKLWLDAVIRDNVDPRIPLVSIRDVPGEFDRGPCLVIRVHRSSVGPHMQTNGGKTLFFSRNNAGVHSLDVREIRSAFLHSAGLADGVRRFRDDRLSKIIAGEIPISFIGDGPRYVVHVVPFAADDNISIDVAPYARNLNKMKPPYTDGGVDGRLTLDGYITWTGNSRAPTISYRYLFRPGAVESVELGHLTSGVNGRPATVHGFAFETFVIRAVEASIAVLREEGVTSPLAVFASLTGMNGVRIRSGYDDHSPFPVLDAFDRDVITLPELLIDQDNFGDLRVQFKPIFDIFWQGSGFHRSHGYDDNGNWRADVHKGA